ncbi:MAG: DUF3800 domain-containing protein [Clostridia bacterium]|nr:DUF3800 domain-containing protein [Clostridia bacterium]
MSNKKLSIFIDESGDFGEYSPHSPYYLVTMVLHDQNIDISSKISSFYQLINNIGYNPHAIHAGPLIRRESIYMNDLMERRKKLFNSLFNFVRILDIHYDFILIKKSECSDVIQLTSKISKSISESLRRNMEYWNQFDEIVVYYDNGQIELTKVLTSVFNALLSNIEFRKVQPKDYILFQAADLICTIELVAKKFETKSPSNSELEFFINGRDFKKNYLKHILKKKL